GGSGPRGSSSRRVVVVLSARLWEILSKAQVALNDSPFKAWRAVEHGAVLARALAEILFKRVSRV
ncbi:hypothetical protein, partial [uncultured Rikenella sp.]